MVDINNILLSAATLLFGSYAYGMEISEKPVTLSYEEFKEQSAYGTLKSNFDCLPNDIIKDNINPHLTKPLSMYFKHKSLNYKYHDKTMKPKYLGVNKNLGYPNIPDMADYAMWDDNYTTKPFIQNTRDIKDNDLVDLISQIKKYVLTHTHIKKASVSPDGETMAITLKSGQLIVFDFPSNTLSNVPGDLDIWRYEHRSTYDDRPPITLWSKKNNLFFSLDPINDISADLNTFFIRSSNSLALLAQYNFCPYNPSAMGLSKDERTVTFIALGGHVWELCLYNDHDIEIIEFIEDQATLYQLCKLWEIHKKPNMQEHKYSAMCSYINLEKENLLKI